jgi:hypothetical protein
MGRMVQSSQVLFTQNEYFNFMLVCLGVATIGFVKYFSDEYSNGQQTLTHVMTENENRDSSVNIVLGYGLDNWGSRFQFPVGAGKFSLHYHTQSGSGTHPASYPMGTRGSFPGGKAAGA